MSKRNSFELTPQTDKKIEKRIKLVPPDGGWGWMVLLGTALSNIVNQSILSVFTLLYGDALKAMGHNIQGAPIVLITVLVVSNFGGPIAGAIVKLTSPRFVSVTGAVACTSGLLLSGFSTNIWHLIFTCGILLGLGLGFIQNASFVAINSYFKVRKNLAVGLTMVGTSVGQFLMPPFVHYLLKTFGFKGACLLLASLSLHGICGTLLIQPVEWHMKPVEEIVEVDENLLEENNTDPIKDTNYNANGNYEIPKPKKTVLRKIYELFDISLLSSLRFLNVIIGTALTVVSIQSFSMLYPFILMGKATINGGQIAYCMSAVGLADIVGRLTLPPLQDIFHIKARMTLIMTSIWLIVVRQILVYQTNFYVLLTMSALYGFGRSMVIVARNIAISDECRMDQVPSAVGLGMLSMGIIVPPVGYFLGWIRDYTDSYTICVTAQNLLLVVLLAMWIPDMI